MQRTPVPKRTPRGTSTLELVIVLPTLLLVLFGSIELSRMWMTMNLVTQAAREGARVAVVTAPWDGGATALSRIDQVLQGANLTAAARNVACAGGCTANSMVTSTVTVNFQTLFPVMLPGLAGPLALTGQAVMRYE